MKRRPYLRSIAAVSVASTTIGCLSSLAPRRGSIGDRDPTPYADGTVAWPGEGFDPANTGFNPDAELLEADPAWHAITRDGSGIEAGLGGGVAVAGDRLYYGTGAGDVVCRTTDGSRRWAYEADPHAGVHSIPSLAREVVYVSSDNGTYALDADDGTELWTSDAWVRWGSSALSGDRLYALESRTRVVALDVETGGRAWSAAVEGAHALAVADDAVYTTGSASDGGVAAAIVDGEREWERTGFDSIHEPPVVAGDAVLVSERDGRLHALDRDDGGTVWEHGRVGDGSTPPAVAHGQVYFPSGNGSRTTCLDLESGDVEWRLATDVTHDQPVAVADGLYVGTPNEGLFAVEPDGTVRWHDEGGRVRGRMAAVDDALYVISFAGPFGSGNVYALAN